MTRTQVTADIWRLAIEQVASGQRTLVSLWGATAEVYMALLDEAPGTIEILSLACPEGRFPSVGLTHAPAIRLERTIQDLFGLVPSDAVDARPWLDHGRWGVTHPLGRAEPAPEVPPPYAFLPVDGEGLHQIPVGPVHAGIIEPGHFRFTASGETVVRLEERLGYVHKGIESLMTGATADQAARLAGRTSGDSTVAYALAFCRAYESAAGCDVPARAHWLRALMAELERLANHFGDIGAVCNDASFALLYTHCGVLRERVLRAADACFGHRLMRDRIVPGGVAADVSAAGLTQVGGLLAVIGRYFPALKEVYDETASLKDRTVGTGLLSHDLARRFGAGGFVGRASGRAFDARRAMAYPPYDALAFDVPTLEAGDVNARVWIRVQEVEQSLALLDQILEGLPGGAVRAPVAAPKAGEGPREGFGVVESFRGDIFVWLRLAADGRVARCHLRDPSWFQWPLLEAVIEGNIVADFPLCNKSFNCSYSGHDL